MSGQALSPEALWRHAIALFEQGDYPKAAQCCELLLKHAPGNASALHVLSAIRSREGRHKEALKLIDQSLKSAPKNLSAMIHRGVVLRERGQAEEAIRQYERAIQRDPSSYAAHEGLIAALADMRRYPDSIARIERIVAEQHVAAEYMPLFRVDQALFHFVTEDMGACANALKAGNALSAVPNSVPAKKWAAIYHEYLSKLLAYRKEHAADYEGAYDAPLYILGDSHALSPSGMRLTAFGARRFVTPKLIIGCKAWHLAQNHENRFKHSLEIAARDIPKGAYVVATFGEIDCRWGEGIMRHHCNHPESDLSETIPELTEGYVRYLAALRDRGGWQLILQSVPAPIVPSGLSTTEMEPLIRIIHIFNESLNAAAKRHGCSWIDAHALSAAPSGVASGGWHLDSNHLKPHYLSEIFNSSSSTVHSQISQ